MAYWYNFPRLRSTTSLCTSVNDRSKIAGPLDSPSLLFAILHTLLQMWCFSTVSCIANLFHFTSPSHLLLRLILQVIYDVLHRSGSSLVSTDFLFPFFFFIKPFRHFFFSGRFSSWLSLSVLHFSTSHTYHARSATTPLLLPLSPPFCSSNGRRSVQRNYSSFSHHCVNEHIAREH